MKVATNKTNQWPADMNIVNPHLAENIREQGMLKKPNSYGYIHLAGEVERVHPLKRTSRAKKELLANLKELANQLCQVEGVREANVFSAFIIPPGSKEGRRLLKQENYAVHIAKFDIAVQVECDNIALAQTLQSHTLFQQMKSMLQKASSYVHCIVAENPKRIDDVDHSRDGVFLFNYFYAADSASTTGVEVLLGVWEYTAGWWTAKANLTNSVPIKPIAGQQSEYSLVNHCRWDKLLDVLPSLLFKPSLDSFVLKNFTANNIVAMPILYKLV